MKYGVFYAPPGETPALIQALGRIGAEKKNQQASLKQMRIVERIEKAAKHYEERRGALVKEYSVEADGQTSIPPENEQQLLADFGELCNCDVPTETLVEQIVLEELWRHGGNGERVGIDIADNDIRLLRALDVMAPAAEPPKAAPQPSTNGARKRAAARR